MQYLDAISKMTMISVRLQDKPFNITVIQVYGLTSNGWRSWSWTVLWRPTRPSRTNTKNDVLFIIGDWDAKVGSQELPGVTGKFGLGIRNEAGQRLIEFCQENTLVIANTLFQQHKKTLHMDITRWSTPKSNWLYSLSRKWRSYKQWAKIRPGADCGLDHQLLVASGMT